MMHSISILPTAIATEADVAKFMIVLLLCEISYHPDDDAHDYVEFGTANKLFTPELADTINALTESALDKFGSRAEEIMTYYVTDTSAHATVRGLLEQSRTYGRQLEVSACETARLSNIHLGELIDTMLLVSVPPGAA